MKTSVFCLVVSLCGLLLTAGCASQQQIQFETLVPAKVALPHNSRISVQSEAGGAAAKNLQKEFAGALARAGLSSKLRRTGEPCYLVIDELKLRLNKAGEKNEPLHMNEVQLNILHERRMQCTYTAPTDTELHARVSLLCCGKVMWSRYHSVIVATPPYTRPSLQTACRQFVDAVMAELTPQRKSYTVQVKLNHAPAELASAVQACRKHDWESALALARKAHQLNPQAPEPIYLIGLLARHYGDYPAATALFKKACAIKPDKRYLKAQQQNLELYRAEFEARQ